MKLVVLYGPPGVGKHTVGKELAKITGYKLFHNHYVVDLLLAIFTWGSKPYLKLGKSIWKLVLAEAVKNDISFIMTYVYSPKDNPFLKKMMNIIRTNGTTHFVKLTCNKTELHKRLVTPERKKHKKLRDVKQLQKLIIEHKLHANIPFEKHLEINTTNLSVRKTALMIKEYYKL